MYRILRRWLIVFCISLLAVCSGIFIYTSLLVSEAQVYANTIDTVTGEESEEREGLAEGFAVDENNFPDAVFRAWILDQANLNGAGSDGYLTEEEIAAVTEIFIQGQADLLIRDLKGIEIFTSLKKLGVTYTSIVSLDLRANTQLSYVNCSYNRLTQLFVDGLTELNALYFEFNYIEDIDLSGNPNLEVLYSRHNLLTTLDLQYNTKLKFIETFDNRLTEIDVSMLKDLEFLHIDHNKLTRLDMSGNLNLQGGGFVVRNNDVREIILPDIPGFTVYYDDFAEQDPIEGYERMEWYFDPQYKDPITGDVLAEGQTLYGKRVPNRYTVNFSAEGGSGAPASVNANYGEAFVLPLQVPSRTGYNFLGWTKYADNKVYAAGEEVINLAGKKLDGDKTTLYAKWKPISYTVRFDANADGVSGTMESVQAEYGNSYPLPSNTFLRQKYDFVGWSRTPSGSVQWYDRQSIYNLTATDGAEVILYAVWELTAEEVRKPFETALDEEVDSLSSVGYFAEDWDSIVNFCSEAKERLVAAGKDSAVMRKIVSETQQKMRAVLDESARVTEIVTGWENKYLPQLEGVFSPPIAAGNGTAVYLAAKQALQGASHEELESFSSLTRQESRWEAVSRAQLQLQEKTNVLNSFLPAGEWLVQAEAMAAMSPSEVRSDDCVRFETLLMDYAALTADEQEFIAVQTLQNLVSLKRMADAKKSAVDALHAHFASFSEEDYTQEGWDRLNALLAQSLNAAENAEEENALLSIVASGKAEMDAVLTEEEENASPDPEEPGGEKPDPEGPGGGTTDPEGPGGETTEPENPGTDEPGDGSEGENTPSSKGKIVFWVTISVAAGALLAAAVILIVRRSLKK